MAAERSFAESLSHINVNDLLREFDDKTIFRGLEMETPRAPNFAQPNGPRAYPRPPPADDDIRRGIQQLSKKADHCDRLLESLSAERTRAPAQPYSLDGSPEPTVHSLAREVSSLRDGQAHILRVLETMQHEMRLGVLAGPSSPPGGVYSSPQGTSSAYAPPPPPAYDVTADPKYKELKKRLLVANLKILELQNKAAAK